MWQCQHCGALVEDQAQACHNCGQAGDRSIADSVAASADEHHLPLDRQASGGMNRREIAVILCKTIGVYYLANATVAAATVVLSALTVFVVSLFDRSADSSRIISFLLLLLPAVVPFLLGLVFWKQAPAIAKRMVSSDPTPVTSFSISTRDIWSIAFSTAGVFIFLDGARLVTTVLGIIGLRELSLSLVWYQSDTWSAILELIFGLWLILGSRGIVGTILRFRNWGRS